MSGRRRYENNIKVDFKAVELEDIDWIHVLQSRDKWPVFVNTVMDLQALIKGVEFHDQASDYKFLNKNSAPCS
jgi:hypothetical protein